MSELRDIIDFESNAHPYSDTREAFKRIKAMSERNELLTIFMEEAAEATVEASKIIRFASETASAVPKMEVEVGDLLCMVDLLAQYGIVNMSEVDKHKAAKREKLKKWSDLNV